MEGARGLMPSLPQGPEPSYVNVGVADRGHIHVQGRAGSVHARLEDGAGRLHAGVEGLAQRVADVQGLEGVIQRIIEVGAGGVVRVQFVGRPQGQPGQDGQVAGGLVDLHQRALAHDQRLGRRGLTAAPITPAQELGPAGPAVEGQRSLASVPPLPRQQDLLVVAVAGRVGCAVHIGQGFGMAEIAGLADGQVEGHGRVRLPVVGDAKPGV